MASSITPEQQDSVRALLSSISHDVKERIRSIRGRIFTIKDDGLMTDPGQLDLLTQLDDQIKNVGDVIGQFRARPAKVDFEVIIDFIQNELTVDTARYMNHLNQLITQTRHSPAKTELEMVMVHSKRMNRIIDSINNYAKSNGKLNRTRFAIHNELDRIQYDLERIILESRARIDAQGLVQFNGDQLKIAQLFQNLIQNSIFYAKTGEDPVINIDFWNIRGRELNVNLKSKITNLYEEESYLYATVKDNGIGIAPEHINRVFDIQFRINRDRQIDENSGGGLGLAIVKSIAAVHEGAVWLESEVNVGTTVHLLLLNKTRTS